MRECRFPTCLHVLFRPTGTSKEVLMNSAHPERIQGAQNDGIDSLAQKVRPRSVSGCSWLNWVDANPPSSV